MNSTTSNSSRRANWRTPDREDPPAGCRQNVGAAVGSSVTDPHTLLRAATQTICRLRERIKRLEGDNARLRRRLDELLNDERCCG